MSVTAENQVNRVVKGLEERLRHADDSSRNDIFFLLLEQLHLFMSLHLGLFKIRFSCSLSDNAFVLAARSEELFSLCGVEERHLRNLEWLIIFNFKVKLF
jgi:hypothetical protein